MTSKAASVVVVVSSLVIGARAHAQSAPEVHDSITDDAKRQSDELGPRVEANVAAGTEAARHAEIRGTARRGALDLELAGGIDQRGERADRGAALRLEHAHGAARARISGSVTDTVLDASPHIATTDVRRTNVAGAWSSGRRSLGGFDHLLVVGASYAASSGSTTDPTEQTNHMAVPRRDRRSDHRFLDAYLKDTLHVIEKLDVSGGFVFEDWRNLSAIETIRYGTDEQMEVQAPRLEDMRISPQLGAVYRAGDHVAVRVNGYRRLRAPTVGQLYAPLVLDAAIVAANPQLHAESVWGGELGPELHAGPITARAVGFWHEIDAPIAAVGGARTNLEHARVLGVATEAMWRPVRPVLATVSYTRSASRIRDAALAGNELSFAPRHRGAALLTFEGSRIATLTGGVRVIGRQVIDASTSSTLAPAALVDAMAARTLAGGLAGFIAVENLLDRRNVAGDDLLGPGRTIQLGLRLDSAHF